MTEERIISRVINIQNEDEDPKENSILKLKNIKHTDLVLFVRLIPNDIKSTDKYIFPLINFQYQKHASKLSSSDISLVSNLIYKSIFSARIIYIPKPVLSIYWRKEVMKELYDKGWSSPRDDMTNYDIVARSGIPIHLLCTNRWSLGTQRVEVVTYKKERCIPCHCKSWIS